MSVAVVLVLLNGDGGSIFAVFGDNGCGADGDDEG